jgi:hypothetical protein
MVGPMVFNPTHPNSKKIQTIGIQSKPGLNEQKNYNKVGLFLNMD